MPRSPLYLVVLCAVTFSGLLALWFAFDSSVFRTAQAAVLAQESAISQAEIPNAPDASTDFKVTVGTVPQVCATTTTITVSRGTTIYYCYSLENKSKYTLTRHLLLDPAIGLQNTLVFTITPSSGLTPAQEIEGVAPAFQPIQSTVTWIATSTNNLTFTAQSKFRVNMPMMALTATVGVNPSGCGNATELHIPAATRVYYCYRLRNSSTLSLTVPKIAGGGDQLSAPLPLVLKPGAAVNFTATNVITQSTDQTISLTGYSQTGVSTFAQAQTTARVPALHLRTTVGTDKACEQTESVTVTVGARVFYCYQLTDLGGVTFTKHRILGSTIFGGRRDEAFTLPVTANVTYPTPLVVTETRVHTVTWIAWNDENLTATASTLVTTTALTTLTVEVFYDVNGANQRDKPLEPLLKNARLTLTYPNGEPLTVTTNMSGPITLTNLPARVYTATVVNQPLYPNTRYPNIPYEATTGPAIRLLDLRNRPAHHALFGFTLRPPIDDDGDGLPNQYEGAGDEDGDGIADYLDYSPKVFIPVLRKAR